MGRIRNNVTFKEMYERQEEFQKKVLKSKNDNSNVPADNLDWFSYHVQAMVEELGEVMKADKRWKTHRNERYEKQEKLDELADVFITAMNISMHSGFSAEDVLNAIINKIEENENREKMI